MNERIKELSDIAYKNHLRNNPESSFGRRADYDKEFAELIIQDCIEINKQELSFTAFERLMNKYQENFGVEE